MILSPCRILKNYSETLQGNDRRTANKNLPTQLVPTSP